MLTTILLLVIIICLLYIYSLRSTEKFVNQYQNDTNKKIDVSIIPSSKQSSDAKNGGNNENEDTICHYIDGETKILTAGDQFDTDIYKTIKRPWDNENIVKETPIGKISTYYFLDPSRRLKFDKKCCVAPAPGEKVGYFQGKYFGSNSNGESGCLCMTKEMSESMGHRGGNA